MHVAAQPVVRDEEHAHAVWLPALGDFVQRGEAGEQLRGTVLERPALEASLGGIFGVNRREIGQIA